ncbi:hypothetical protein P4661_29145 [Priestia megaterium]|uniref:hypothetical protein n=1 Tax=Priestia megaterium TaxID=1404 RepID=UPI001EDA02DF|nr:hypothetical protein [Priestia megaterium]MDH3161317.1 hypothetical protein [Priestia megaterium]MED4116903.1 hypothetical protein [Priestia megaterium]UKJ83836.1 hypothetical protein H1W83_29665 [Priestia megaterium]
MRAKTEKARHVVMFKATGEFCAHEVNQDKIRMGFFVCPSCEVRVHYKQDHFFSREHTRNCTFVKEQFKKKAY